MRHLSTSFLFLILTIALAACTAPSIIPESAALDQVLADKNYSIGAEVERISEIRLDERTYVDPRNFILPAAGERDYLVHLKQKCYGLAGNPILMRNGRYYELGKYDRFVTRYEQSNIDQCFVDAVYELN